MDLASRCMFLDFLQEIRRSGLDNPAGVRGGQPTRKPNVKDEQLLASLDWGIILRTCNRWYDRVVTALRVEERATRQKEIDRSVTDLRALKKETMGRGAMIGAVINEIAQGVGPKRAVAEKVGDVLVYYMLPAFSRVQDAADRDEQVQRNLHVAFALANYQRDRGRYPAKLDELVPRYLPAIPDDLFSGKALIYRPSEKGYLVYSVGPNGIDEGGSTLEDNPPGDDLSVRMPLPRLKQEK
jgi:hypothetical protein